MADGENLRCELPARDERILSKREPLGRRRNTPKSGEGALEVGLSARRIALQSQEVLDDRCPSLREQPASQKMTGTIVTIRSR